MELEAYGHDKISIHALREEGDRQRSAACVCVLQFLSTPSARRATSDNIAVLFKALCISIHALREEGDMPCFRPCLSWSISIHALREEGDARRTAPTA